MGRVAVEPMVVGSMGELIWNIKGNKLMQKWKITSQK